nr:MAG TPA: Endonuclease [Bacteriophage sp.]
MNKKVRNATVIEYNGIKFKSKLEAAFYKLLIEAGFEPQYEQRTYLLWEGYKPTIPFYTKDKKTKLLKLKDTKLKNITYTPDFTFNYNGRLIIIEAKGKENDTYPLKRKLFRGLLECVASDNPLFFEVFSQKQLLQAIEIIKSYETIDKEDTGVVASSPTKRYKNRK